MVGWRVVGAECLLPYDMLIVDGHEYRYAFPPLNSVDLPMANASIMVQCQDCGADLPPESAKVADQPCAKCGSINLHVTIELSDTITFRDWLKGTVRNPAKKKPRRVEFKTGASYSVSLGKWVDRKMHLDRDRDTYRETVTDPDTGNVIHHCEEPLSSHQGHGSAKRKRRD